MLEHITPVMLTYNEEQNVWPTLSRLAWAKDIVVVDSGSTDGTLEALSKFDNVRVFKRRFDTHASQWRYATEETQIATNWILRLDADYQVSDALTTELSQLAPDAPVSAYRVGFDYAVFSHKLLSSLYPPNTILLRKGCFSVRDKGHTETWDVHGPVATLRGRIVHDDWKLTGQWLAGQARYMRLELEFTCLVQSRIGSLAEAPAPAHANCGLSVLSVWQGAHSKWSCRNVLCASANGSRSGPVADGA